MRKIRIKPIFQEMIVLSKKNEIKEMSSRYCPKLDDNVIVMSTSDKNGFTQRTCLSSHLCRGDDRVACEHDSASAGSGEKNQTIM